MIKKVTFDFRQMSDGNESWGKCDFYEVGKSKVIEIKEVLGTISKPYHVKVIKSNGVSIEIFKPDTIEMNG